MYGWAMSNPLPEKDFEWYEGLTEEEVRNYQEDDVGYFVECDLGYPHELHDKHNDYPLAPVRTCVTTDMLSPHSKELYRKVYDLNSNQKIPHEKVEKLLLTLQDKEKYVVHIRMLQWYLKQGLVLKQIHRVIKFKQSPWLKPYIDFNTEKRKQATTDFEKDFFKLMNNAPYGKTMEDVKNHMDFELVTDVKRYDKLVNEPTFKHTSIINENIVGVERAKKEIYLNKPIAVGVAVFDLSKLHMYGFYNDIMKANYGDNMELLYTDTDSLIINVQTEDIYRDFRQPGLKEHFDFSEYPVDHPNYDSSNAKVLGKFKCETNGKPIEEWIGLKAKMYALRVGGKDKLVAKGVPKDSIKKYTSFDVYKKVLEQDVKTNVSFNCIRSQKHKLHTMNISKVGLTNFDNKRHYLDNINSLAYGHKNIMA